jgi:hypothetical protein
LRESWLLAVRDQASKTDSATFVGATGDEAMLGVLDAACQAKDAGIALREVTQFFLDNMTNGVPREDDYYYIAFGVTMSDRRVCVEE